MAYDENNPFAKILRGEATASRVYENDYSLAFMDNMPQADGHTLVIPKYPAENILEVDSVVLSETIKTVQAVTQAVKQTFSAPGIMIAQLNGSAAGQTVFHLHFHILPRHDGMEFKLHARKLADSATLEEHAARIRAHLPS